MKTNRPKIEVPLQPIDIAVDIISALIIVALITYTYLSYTNLPETIPTHYNASGEVDGFGGKNTIWLLPGICTLMFTGLFILNKFPHLHNYMVNITEENALKNYRLSTRLVRFLNLFTILMMGYIQYTTLESAKGEHHHLGAWFTPTIIIGSLLPIIFVFYLSNKINNEYDKENLF